MKVSVVGYVPRGEGKAITLQLGGINPRSLKKFIENTVYHSLDDANGKLADFKKRRVIIQVKVEDVQATKKGGKR